MATRLNVTGSGRLPLSYPPRAGFEAQLTNSVIPTSSMGAITYTRATPATVADNEGVIRNCLSGEARFQGARRVQNLYTYSEDITNAVWNHAYCTSAKNAGIAPDGTNTAGLVTSAVAATLIEFNQNYNIVSGQTYILSVSLKANGGLQYVQLVGNAATFGYGYINVDLSNGTITANVPGAANMQATVTPEANGFYRIQFKATAIANLANNHLSVAMIPSGTSARIASFPGDGIKGFYYWHPQFEDVTGQSVQTAGEYVSTNVLTSTPFHGANVDGVKYFDTDVNGVAIPKTTLKGLLVEGTRTNLLLQSEDFSTTWGIAGGGSVSVNQSLSPDGAIGMDKFTPSVTNGLQYISQFITTTATQYAFSVYAKNNGIRYMQLWSSSTISSGYVNFDLSNGTVEGSSLWTGSIEALPNGIYRCSATTNTALATNSIFCIGAIPSANSLRQDTIAGNGTNGILLWGAQLEAGQNASSYIPTTATTATRNTDSLIMNTKNAIDTYGACSFIATIEDNSQFDRRIMSFTNHTLNRLQFQVKRSGLSGANLFYGDGSGVPSITPGRDVGANNVVIAWTNLSNVSLYMNNTKYVSGVAPNLIFTTVDIGSAGGIPGFGCIKNVRIWKTRPTDAELLALSNSSY